MCNPRPGWVNGAINVCKCCPRIEKLFLIYSLYILYRHLCLFAQFSICILCDICFRNLRINDHIDHKADHSYLTYQIKMATNFPVLGICNFLSILPNQLLIHLVKDNNVSASAFSQGCVCWWPGTTVPGHLVPLLWPVFHVDMMFVVSRKLGICCCFHFCWLYTEKAVVFQGLSLRWVSLVSEIYYRGSGMIFFWCTF